MKSGVIKKYSVFSGFDRVNAQVDFFYIRPKIVCSLSLVVATEKELICRDHCLSVFSL